MRSPKKQKPVVLEAKAPAASDSWPLVGNGQICPPVVAFKIKAVLLVAAVVFLLLRLYFLPLAMTTWDDTGSIDTVARNPNHISPVVLMRQNWSFAPGQYFLTSALVRFAHDYTSLLFWGRLSSLLIWCAGLGLAYASFRHLLGKEYLVMRASLAVWMAISLRGLFDSSQAYNYVCAMPCSVLLAWLFVSPAGFAWLTEPRRLWRPALAGFAAAMLCWLTFQSLFIGLGGFLMLGTLCLWKRNFAAFKGIMAAGIAYSAVFWFVYSISLKYVTSRGIGWPGGIPGDSLTDKLVFLPVAWFRVLENVFTFVLPPVGSAIVAAIVLTLAVWGFIRLAKAKRRDAVEMRILAFGAVLAIVWSGAAYAKLFPLSPTRHTYVLQFPLMLCLGVAMKYLRFSWRTYAIGTSIMVGVFAVSAPATWRSVKNQWDVAGVTKLLSDDPNSLLLQYPGGSCLDFLLLLREHPEWQTRVADGTWNWPAYMQHLAAAPAYISIYSVGVESAMGEKNTVAAEAAGFKVVLVKEIAATGTIEPWRSQYYPLNGFRLYKLERK